MFGRDYRTIRPAIQNFKHQLVTSNFDIWGGAHLQKFAGRPLAPASIDFDIQICYYMTKG